jgi:hypothetical protein
VYKGWEEVGIKPKVEESLVKQEEEKRSYKNNVYGIGNEDIL